MGMLITQLGDVPAGAVLGWIVAVGLALVCIYGWAEKYRKVRNDYDNVQETIEKHGQEIIEARDAIEKIQEQLATRLKDLKVHDRELDDKLDELSDSIKRMHDYQKKRDVHDLKDRIEKSYRVYRQRAQDVGADRVFITKTELEILNGIMESYEEAGGNSFVHSDIKPAILKWEVISDADLVEKLQKSMKKGI